MAASSASPGTLEAHEVAMWFPDRAQKRVVMTKYMAATFANTKYAENHQELAEKLWAVTCETLRVNSDDFEFVCDLLDKHVQQLTLAPASNGDREEEEEEVEEEEEEEEDEEEDEEAPPALEAPEVELWFSDRTQKRVVMTKFLAALNAWTIAERQLQGDDRLWAEDCWIEACEDARDLSHDFDGVCNILDAYIDKFPTPGADKPWARKPRNQPLPARQGRN